MARFKLGKANDNRDDRITGGVVVGGGDVFNVVVLLQKTLCMVRGKTTDNA